MAGKNSNYNHKSGGTGFLITAGIIFLALKGLPGLLVGVVIGAGVGAIASIVGKKLDTTTHNRRDRVREAREAEIRLQEETRRRQEEERRRQAEASRIPLTGNQEADNVILKGQEMLNTIREENIVITDETLSAQMNTLSDKCQQIFRTVSSEPAKASHVRKFMNYYLPTTIKLLNAYDRMSAQGIEGENLNKTMKSIDAMLDDAIAAYKKMLDSLFANQALDIETDIQVMNTMLAREGLSGAKDFDVKEEEESAPAGTTAVASSGITLHL